LTHFFLTIHLGRLFEKVHQKFVISLCGIAKVFRKVIMNLNYRPDYKLFNKLYREKHSKFKEE
jgi:hypothetical protein